MNNELHKDFHFPNVCEIRFPHLSGPVNQLLWGLRSLLDPVFYFHSIQFLGFFLISLWSLERFRRSGLDRKTLFSRKQNVEDTDPDVLPLLPGRFPHPTGL